MSDSLPDKFLNCDFFAESLQRVHPVQFFKLSRSVLIQELVDGEEATTDLDLDLSTLDFDHDLAGTELVDALRLSHEHDLQLLAIRVVVDILRKVSVDRVSLDRDVDSDARLHVQDVLLESLNLDLEPADAFEQLQARLVCLEASGFDLQDVVRGDLQFPLQVLLVVQQALVLAFELSIFLHK